MGLFNVNQPGPQGLVRPIVNQPGPQGIVNPNTQPMTREQIIARLGSRGAARPPRVSPQDANPLQSLFQSLNGLGAFNISGQQMSRAQFSAMLNRKYSGLLTNFSSGDLDRLLAIMKSRTGNTQSRNSFLEGLNVSPNARLITDHLPENNRTSLSMADEKRFFEMIMARREARLAV